MAAFVVIFALVAVIALLMLALAKKTDELREVEATMRFYKASAAALKEQVAKFDGDGSGYVGGSRRRAATKKTAP